MNLHLPAAGRSVVSASRVSFALFALVATVALPSRAVDVGLRVEPGLAIPLGAPQGDLFGVGGAQTVKGLIGLTPWLDIGPSVSFLMLPLNADPKISGTAWTFGGGARLKVPHDSEFLFGVSPWLDADVMYVRTGDLNRPGFDVAAGVALPIGEDRTFWLGPFVRYMHILQQPQRAGFDNTDAKVLIAGLSGEFGSGVPRPRAEPVAAEPEVVTKEVIKEVIKEVAVCADGDQDGVPDQVDHCPEVKGSIEDHGCPPYQKVVVKRDKLELKEKLYFAYDEATLEPESFPILDDVVRALKDNRGFKVQIEGHTDSTGGDVHNQSLSERRAEAVLNYLQKNGIAKERLRSKGFAATVPTDTNTTAAGRENNRRVEFVVSFIIVNEGAKK